MLGSLLIARNKNVCGNDHTRDQIKTQYKANKDKNYITALSTRQTHDVYIKSTKASHRFGGGGCSGCTDANVIAAGVSDRTAAGVRRHTCRQISPLRMLLISSTASRCDRS